MSEKLASPNSLFKAGVDMMLKGEQPKTLEDWTILFHFWAYNVSPEMLPSALDLMFLIFKPSVSKKNVQKIATHYRDLALKRQEEMLQKIIGKPVSHEHLKHLRSVISANLEYDGIISVFEKAGLNPSWPNHNSWESWAKLCNALFLLKGEQFKATQAIMAKIISGDK